MLTAMFRGMYPAAYLAGLAIGEAAIHKEWWRLGIYLALCVWYLAQVIDHNRRIDAVHDAASRLASASRVS